jgi:hypothetical protein
MRLLIGRKWSMLVIFLSHSDLEVRGGPRDGLDGVHRVGVNKRGARLSETRCRMEMVCIAKRRVVIRLYIHKLAFGVI